MGEIRYIFDECSDKKKFEALSFQNGRTALIVACICLPKDEPVSTEMQHGNNNGENVLLPAE